MRYADIAAATVFCPLLAIMGGAGYPGEGGGEADAARGKREQDEKREEGARIKEILARKNRGEVLTPEEKNLIEEHARRVEKLEKKAIRDRQDRGKVETVGAERGGGPWQMPPVGPPPLPPDLNVLDAVRIELACILAEKGRIDEAVAALKSIVEKSPDPAGRSAAAFSLSEILQRRGDIEGAKANLRLVVSGPLAGEARRRIVGPLVGAGRFAEAMSELLHFVRNAGTPLDKARAVRHYAEVAAISGDVGLAAKAIEDIPRLISHDEAAKAMEQEERELASRRARMPGGPPGAGPEREWPEDIRDRFMEGVPEELREKVRETKGLPPGERRKVLREAWEAAIEAEKAGDAEKVRRLREAMERIEKFRDDRPPGKGLKGERRQNLDGLRAEIKELEDAGRFEDARRLRRQLEAAEAGRHPGEAKDDF
ncbi:MAG: hypothetical protein N3A38_12580 [Planctomycetota bacterium]|nr:hypothetical protein [Planctomycetota bacterium]